MVEIFFTDTEKGHEFTLKGFQKIAEYFRDSLILRETPTNLFKYLSKNHSRTFIDETMFLLQSSENLDSGLVYIFYKSNR